MAVMFMCTTVTSYALSYFLPTILRLRLRFSLVEAQCLAAPPYVFAILVAMTGAYFSDRTKLRGPFIIANSALCLIGLGVLYAPGVPAAGQYTAVFLVAAGTNSNVPFVIGYMQNNIHTSSRRAVLSALQAGFGAIGGIFGSLVFRQQDAPIYRPGLAACMACNGFIILWVCIFTVYFRRENKKQEAGYIIAGKKGFRFAI
jgi:cyanate permease